MIRMVLAAAAWLALAPIARADMYDYGFSFASAAQARADAVMLAGHYDVTLGWAQDHTIAGLQCWEPSNDVAGVHTYLTGFYVLVSVPSQAPLAALLNDAHLAFALDRTVREAGLGQPFVVKNNIGAVLSNLGCQPMFASPNPYPIGGYN